MSYGKPEDVPGDCNAHLILGDDYGDGQCTVRCQLLPHHAGNHREVCREGTVTIEWQIDEREEQ